jgi:DNA primase
VDILAVAEDHTRLQRRGHRWVGLCPLHREKTPSFTTDPDQGLFYCFGCGAGGDAIKLHMMLSGDDFPSAIEGLARRFGVPLPAPSRRRGAAEPDLEGALEAAAAWFREQLERHREPRDYLERRQIPLELARRYGLGFAPPGWANLLETLKPRLAAELLLAAGLVAPSEQRPGQFYDRFRHRLIFPVRNASGRLVGFGGRALGEDRAKYLNTPETERFRKGSLLYGLDQAKRPLRESGRALLVEGYFDVLGALAAGVEGAVASMGTALTADQARLLARHAGEVVIAYDGDAAGEEAARRALPLLLGAGLAVRRARLPAGCDPDTLRLEEGDAKLQGLVAAAPDAIELELERLLPPDALRQPQAGARLATPVAELLVAVPDPILRYTYGRLAAQRLGFPFELLASRLKGTGRRPTVAPEPAAGAASRTPGRDLEEAVLRELLALLPRGAAPAAAAPELPDALSLPAVDAFWDPGCRSLYAALRALQGERGEGGATLARLRAALEDGDGSVDLMAKLLLERGDAPRETSRGRQTPGEKLRLSLVQLNRRWNDQRIKELSQQILEAQRRGDGDRLQSLVEEKSMLSRQLHLGATGA